MSDLLTIGALHARHVGDRVIGANDVKILGVQHDSRRVVPGDLFAALSDDARDRATHALDAVGRGAVAVLCEAPLEVPVPQLVAGNTRRALARAAELVYGEPTRALRVVGITGTNGKTTTAHILRSILEHCGQRTAVLGTTGAILGGEARHTGYTTPLADDISRFARQAVDAGTTHLVMEVSSHGLALHRADGVDFDIAAFTNLTHDHLDYHLTKEAYGRAKARLFMDLAPAIGVFNIDDAFGRQLAESFAGRAVRCSMTDDAADVRVVSFEDSLAGVDMLVQAGTSRLALKMPLLGAHNVCNLLIAAACAVELGLGWDQIAQAVAALPQVPGRMERVGEGQPVVFVDYAHTPDALEHALSALRPLTSGRLMVVFGAGGDRDRAKRPAMGAAAVRLADVVVLTSDNPRSEAPERILAEVAAGMTTAGCAALDAAALASSRRGFVMLADRDEAIARAIAAAGPTDVVLLAGKGHETYQELAEGRIPFDDREHARRALDRRRGAS